MNSEIYAKLSELGLGDPVLFGEPRWLLLIALAPLVALFLPRELSIWARGRNLLTAVLRALALCCIALALAQPALIRRVPDLSVVVAVDQSASMTPARQADARAFAQRYLDALPTEVTVRQVSSADLGEHADLAVLIELAAASAPVARTRRVLLLSDGAETERGPSGSPARLAAAYHGAQGLRIYPIPPASDEHNLSVESLDLPLSVTAGGPAQGRVRLRGEGAGRLELRLGDRVLAGQDFELRGGEKTFTLSFVAPPAGVHRLEARLSQADAWPEDDARGGWMTTIGEGPVLLVGEGAKELAPRLSSQGLPAQALEILPERPPAGAALVLLAPDMERWPKSLPRALAAWVREEGGDLLIAGGPKGLGADESWMDPLDRALPLIFPKRRKREPPPLAVAYVIDRSDSMAREHKLELAMSAVDASVRMLPPEARVGVLSFSDSFSWAVPMTRARNPDAIAQAVRGITVSGGTQIYPALNEAFEALNATDAVLRHIILLTDGAGVTRLDQHLDLVERIRASNVTISTVALSREAEVSELKRVADLGRGRAWVVVNSEDLPRIFVDETMTLLRRNTKEGDQRVRPIAGSALAAGPDWSTAPPLAGFSEARARPTADLGLVVGEATRPLLASWRYGLGSATVFASQLGTGWGVRWMEWKPQDAWLAGLIRAVRRRPPSDELRLRLSPQEDGLELALQALDALGNPREKLSPRLRARGDGGERELTLQERAPGHYAAKVSWDGPLLLSVFVEAGDGSPAGAVQAQSAPPVPRELAGPMSDPVGLAAIASATGGEVLPDIRDFVEDDVRAREERHALWPWAFWSGLALALVDLVVRRLRWTFSRAARDPGAAPAPSRG